MADALQTYVNLVSGLTRTTRARASATAHALLAQAGLEEAANEASDRVTKLAEEILHASRANREMFEKVVTAEVDRAAARLGLSSLQSIRVLALTRRLSSYCRDSCRSKMKKFRKNLKEVFASEGSRHRLIRNSRS